MKLFPRVAAPALLAALILCGCGGTTSLGQDGGSDGGLAAGEGGIAGDGGSEGGVFCTPGNFVFCRCADRAEGTKMCNADGRTFAPCSPCTGN